MKKILTILAIAFTTVLMSACGASSKMLTNDPYTVTATGFANNDNDAWKIAVAEAKGKIMDEFKSEVVSETQKTYTQTQSGLSGRDKSTYSIQVRTLADGSISDVVINAKKLSWWRCRPYRYGYEVTAKVTPSNIESYR